MMENYPRFDAAQPENAEKVNGNITTAYDGRGARGPKPRWTLRAPRLINSPCSSFTVHVHVKPEWIESFKQATVENARQSAQEPGVARFEVMQQLDDPSRFVLIESYPHRPPRPAAHKETAHYQKWRDTVAPMMSEPRTSVKFAAVFPA